MTQVAHFPTLPEGPVGARDRGTQRLLLTDVHLLRGGPAEPVWPAPAERLAQHLARLGPRPLGGPGVVEVVRRSGLDGQGGAHVPAALKWQALAGGGGPLTVVANAAESEPVAGKDGTLLRQRPHLVLDGLLIAAEALGARRAVVWLHGDDESGRRTLLSAVQERRRAGAREAVEVVAGPVHYLAGESSAIARGVHGALPLPTVRRPATNPYAPRTLVHNVETLARLALLARGHPPTTTRLLSVLGTDRVVVEVAETTTFGRLLADLGWTGRPQAVLLGGYGGLWAPWHRVAQLPVDERALRAEGLTLGAGVLIPLDADACGLRVTADLVAYLASMSARQCGPCRFGLPALAESARALAEGRGADRAVRRLLDDAELVEGRGACHHPDGATRLVASAVATFEQDIAAHVAGRPCPAPSRPVFPAVGGGPAPWQLGR